MLSQGTQACPGCCHRGLERPRAAPDAEHERVCEFNGQSAAAITHATDAAKSDDRFVWACVWNSNHGTVTVLSGARLEAFRAAIR